MITLSHLDIVRAVLEEIAKTSSSTRITRIANQTIEILDDYRSADTLATDVLGDIAALVPFRKDGEPCPVCNSRSHQDWCWYPKLLAWDEVWTGLKGRKVPK